MMADDIDTSFQAAIDSGKINGAVLCATDAQGNFFYNQPLGERTLPSGEKLPERMDDVVYLASATKLITTIAALQCVEEGLLTLTGDLSSVAPELAAKQVITKFSDDGETPILEAQKGPITLEMLLTHSSGASYDFVNPVVGRWRDKFAPIKEGGDRRPVEVAFEYPLGFQPGKSWMYGPGLDWAGRIIERLTGMSLGERMQLSMFNPLGINDAQFFPITRDDLRARLVDFNPQDPEALGRAVLGGNADMNKRIGGHFGGHSLFMSGTSYLKIMQSILANDGKLLKPDTVDDMFKDHLNAESSAGHEAALAGPAGVFFRVGVSPDTKAGHGLGGLLTLESVDGWYGERTLTWGGGRTFVWFIDRENGLCGVGAVQAALPFDAATVETLKQNFCHDIYRKHAVWKAQQKQASQ